MFLRVLAAVRRAIVPLALTLLVASCGGGGSDYGVSSSNPLGTKAAFTAALKDAKHVTTKELQPGALDHILGMFPEVAYAKGLGGVEFDDAGQKVIALCEPSGKVKAVVVHNLRTGSQAFSKVGPPLESFVARLWVAAAKKEPVFEKEYMDSRTTAQHLVAKFGTPKKGGVWRKISASGDLAHINMISDQMALWAK